MRPSRTDQSQDHQLGLLEGTLNTFMANMQQSEERNGESIAKLHEKFDQLDKRHSETSDRIRSMDERLKEVEPVAKDLSRWKERLTGMGMLLTFIGAVLGASATLFWRKIVTLVSGH